MRTSKFSETQIVSILKQQEAGVKVADICREHGISQATFYKRRSKCGGMDASMLKRVKELEQEKSVLLKDPEIWLKIEHRTSKLKSNTLTTELCQLLNFA